MVIHSPVLFHCNWNEQNYSTTNINILSRVINKELTQSKRTLEPWHKTLALTDKESKRARAGEGFVRERCFLPLQCFPPC